MNLSFKKWRLWDWFTDSRKPPNDALKWARCPGSYISWDGPYKRITCAVSNGVEVLGIGGVSVHYFALCPECNTPRAINKTNKIFFNHTFGTQVRSSVLYGKFARVGETWNHQKFDKRSYKNSDA